MKTRLSLYRPVLTALATAMLAGCGSEAAAADPLGSEASAARAGWRGGGGPRLPQVSACSGEPETISGVVASIGIPGEGLTIETSGSYVTLWGVGPLWYWDAQGVARPEVGDAVDAVYTYLTTVDEPVLLSLTVDGRTLELRDPSSCRSLWAGRRFDAAPAGSPQAPVPPGGSLPPAADDRCVGSPETVSGTVESTGIPGNGITIATASGSAVTVYGLGPVWYWSDRGVGRPVVGDSVEVLVSYVTTTTVPVILGITVNGTTLELRDADTCLPLW